MCLFPLQDFFNGLESPAFTFELLQLREIESAILCHVAEERWFNLVRGVPIAD